jgi:hypothetical protein
MSYICPICKKDFVRNNPIHIVMHMVNNTDLWQQHWEWLEHYKFDVGKTKKGDYKRIAKIIEKDYKLD